MNNIRPLSDNEMRAFAPVRARLLGAQGKGGKGYYAEAAFKVKPVAAEGLGTWAVDDSWRIYVDPTCLPGGDSGWDVIQCTSVFEHELNHLLRDHAIRMELHGGKNRDASKSNLAADLEINDDMDADSFVVEVGVTPSKFNLPDNKTAEWYYENLPSEDDTSDKDEDSEGEGEGESESESEGNSGKQGNKPAAGNCGSGAGGKPIDGELDPDD